MTKIHVINKDNLKFVLTDNDIQNIIHFAKDAYRKSAQRKAQNQQFTMYKTKVEYFGMRYDVQLDLTTDQRNGHFIRELGWVKDVFHEENRQKLLEEHKDTIPMFL